MGFIPYLLGGAAIGLFGGSIAGYFGIDEYSLAGLGVDAVLLAIFIALMFTMEKLANKHRKPTSKEGRP